MKPYSLIEESEKNFLDGDLEAALNYVYQALQDAALDCVREAGLECGPEFSGESDDVKKIAAFVDSTEVPQRLRARWSHLASWAATSDAELTPDRIKKEFSIKIEEAKTIIMEIKTLIEGKQDTAQ